MDGTNDYVLIADDDPDARELLERIVRNMGLRCKTACDGFEAIERVSEEKPALILLDLMMPRMNGFIVLNNLQTNRDWRTINVIVLSAVVQTNMSTIPQVAHMIQKARFSPREMQEVIRTVLAGGRYAPAAPAVSAQVGFAAHAGISK
jgi:CheY-like chemotaxis protein